MQTCRIHKSATLVKDTKTSRSGSLLSLFPSSTVQSKTISIYGTLTKTPLPGLSSQGLPMSLSTPPVCLGSPLRSTEVQSLSLLFLLPRRTGGYRRSETVPGRSWCFLVEAWIYNGVCADPWSLGSLRIVTIDRNLEGGHGSRLQGQRRPDSRLLMISMGRGEGFRKSLGFTGLAFSD